MLAAISVGSLSGAIAGWSVDAKLKPPPDSPWKNRSVSEASSEAPYYLIEVGPEDLDPLADRRPTWERDADYEPYTYETRALINDPEFHLDTPDRSQSTRYDVIDLSDVSQPEGYQEEGRRPTAESGRAQELKPAVDDLLQDVVSKEPPEAVVNRVPRTDV